MTPSHGSSMTDEYTALTFRGSSSCAMAGAADAAAMAVTASAVTANTERRVVMRWLPPGAGVGSPGGRRPGLLDRIVRGAVRRVKSPRGGGADTSRRPSAPAQLRTEAIGP